METGFESVFWFALSANVCKISRVSAKNKGEKPHPERSQVIRLGKGQAEKLQKLADKFGVTQSQIMKWAVDAMLSKVESSGGRMTLPFSLEKEPTLMVASDPIEYKVTPKQG